MPTGWNPSGRILLESSSRGRLVKFPGDATVQRDAAALVAGVPYGPGLATVEMALRDFAIRHFADGNTNAAIPRPTRHTTPRG